MKRGGLRALNEKTIYKFKSPPCSDMLPDHFFFMYLITQTTMCCVWLLPLFFPALRLIFSPFINNGCCIFELKTHAYLLYLILD